MRASTLTDGDVGVWLEDPGSVAIEGCDILEQRSAGIVAVDTPFTLNKRPIVISENLLVTSYHGWLNTSYGIWVERRGGGGLEFNREFEIVGNTIRGGDVGMWVPSPRVRSAQILANIVADCYLEGIDCVVDSLAEENIELLCNNAFGNGGCNYCNIGTVYPSSNIELDPLFCDGIAGTESNTLRIDSPSAPNQNPMNGTCGLAGARRVECAWGELTRNTTVEEDEAVLVVGDVTVPSTMSLTLEKGVTLTMHPEDIKEGGSDAERVELIVDGDLVVEGEEGNRVAIRGATESVGSWWGIDGGSSGTIAMENADLSHAQYPLMLAPEDTSHVTGCSFLDYEQTALMIASGEGGLHLLIGGNTFYPSDGAQGIELLGLLDGDRIHDNDIWGDEPMLRGMSTMLLVGDPILDANHVSGFTVSEGIKLTGGSPDLVENEITGNLAGILVSGGTPRIGLGSSSDNVITQNEDGIVITGGVPVIRNNQIVENRVWGVRVQNDADPNLGTDPDPGQNTFEGNYYGCIVNENSGGTPIVRAERNYYGLCDGGFPEVCWSGNVDVGNWLCTEPAAARRPDITRVDGGSAFVLRGARPNPTVAGSGIAFRVEGERRVVGARVFDVAGRLVRELPEQPFDPGDHVLAWDGMTQDGRSVRTGMYFVRVTAGDDVTGTVKVLVAR